MLATTCYSREDLERYLHGWADDQLSAAIEHHLESCRRCDDTLSELDSTGDTLIRTLQVTGDRGSAHTPDWVRQMADSPVDQDRSSPVPQQTAGKPEELGDYELIDVLGRGGMSVVFVARHKHLGREVALKVLLPTAQQHGVSRDRFSREMRAVGALDHPSIVRATDAGEWNQTLYLVMERIEGVDLNHVSRCEGPLRVADACAIGIEVARGLAHAHQQGVVHRDIKPSNLMLDGNGAVKILDFGLARLQTSACDVSLQTTMGQLLGTLDFMAPEQASGGDVDARADIYALGATLFKLLTGSPPHGRSADMPILEYLHRLANQDAARLDQRRDQMPAELVELMGNMLQRDPSCRVGTVAEVIERLRPLADGADLPRLAARSVEKAARTADSPPGSGSSIKECLAQLGVPSHAGDAPPAKNDPAISSPLLTPVGHRWLSWVAAVAGLVGLIALTIVLTLKTPEGEIRIESELDNVRVEIVDEKDRADVLTVDRGGKVTTVRAGRYRIRLDSPADGIEITPQELVVTKDKAVIAKVKKIASGEPTQQANPSQRDPVVAIEAQLQIAEAVAELADARNQPTPDEQAIKALEEKLARLRALSRPIPTEPVYEGRTLADWVAQMRYEREYEAKTTAAKNVLKLASTRPPDEQMELILDAGSRLLAWSGDDIDELLDYELINGRNHSRFSLDEAAALIVKIDAAVAAWHLDRALRGQDPDRRHYAILLACHLRDHLRQGDWPAVLTALEARSQSDSGAEKIVAQLTLAACVPEAAGSERLLAAIDTNSATTELIIAMFVIADERRLEIASERQFAWTSAYLDKVADPRELEVFWEKPRLGPFRNVDWNQVDDDLQAQVNTVVGPLLESFGQAMAQVDDRPHDQQQQLQAARKSRVLTHVLELADLTGPPRETAVALLERRLDQLLNFRDRSTEAPSAEMDVPADVACAVLMLSGQVPDSIKRQTRDESSYMAEQLKAARKALTPRDGAVMFRGNPAQFGRGFDGVTPSLASWYPYEWLAMLQEFDSLIARQERSRSGRSLSRSNFGIFELARQRGASVGEWRVDPRLVIEYSVAYDRAAAPLRPTSPADLRDELASSDDLNTHQMRHRKFRETIARWMEQTADPKVVERLFNLWSNARSDKEIEAKLGDWLAHGDPTRTRASMQLLLVRDEQRDPDRGIDVARGRFVQTRGNDVASAIDRIAEQQPLNARDMYFLHILGDKAPRAVSHAINYLLFWLEHPEQRAHQQDISGLPRRTSALYNCVHILSRTPQPAWQVKQRVATELSTPAEPFSAEDRTELERLLNHIVNVPEEES